MTGQRRRLRPRKRCSLRARVPCVLRAALDVVAVRCARLLVPTGVSLLVATAAKEAAAVAPSAMWLAMWSTYFLCEPYHTCHNNESEHVYQNF